MRSWWCVERAKRLTSSEALALTKRKRNIMYIGDHPQNKKKITIRASLRKRERNRHTSRAKERERERDLCLFALIAKQKLETFRMYNLRRILNVLGNLLVVPCSPANTKNILKSKQKVRVHGPRSHKLKLLEHRSRRSNLMQLALYVRFAGGG